MKLTVHLLASDSLALRKFANEFGFGERVELAAGFALQQYLIAQGYVEPPYALDEDTPTAGEA